MAMRRGKRHERRCPVEAAVRYTLPSHGPGALGAHSASQKSKQPSLIQMKVSWQMRSIHDALVTIDPVWMHLHVGLELSIEDIGWQSGPEQ